MKSVHIVTHFLFNKVMICSSYMLNCSVCPHAHKFQSLLSYVEVSLDKTLNPKFPPVGQASCKPVSVCV